MSIVVDRIRDDIANTRQFANKSSYLNNRFLVIYLLFMGEEDEEKQFAIMAKDIIAVKKGCAFINIHPQKSVAEVINEVVESITYASNAQAELDHLNTFYFCSIVFDGNRMYEEYIKIAEELRTYCIKNNFGMVWLPFFINKINSLDATYANHWLKQIMATQDLLGVYSCRCCVMSDRNEKGKGVAPERLIYTVLLISNFFVEKKMGAVIGSCINRLDGDVMGAFYTAQTISISNPVVSRMMRRIRMLLNLVWEENDNADLSQIDLGFMKDILKDYINKLPMENGSITFKPLFGVIPTEDNNDFKLRLKRFSEQYYLDDLYKKDNQQRLINMFHDKFIKECLSLSPSMSLFTELKTNGTITRLLSGISMDYHIQDLPEIPKTRMYSDANVNIYRDAEQWVKNGIYDYSKNIIKNYMKSELYNGFPKIYRHAKEIIENEVRDLDERIRRQNMIETTLSVADDLDENWLRGLQSSDEGKKDIKKARNSYIDCICKIIADKIPSEEALESLFQALYHLVIKTSVDETNSYMEMISTTCSPPNSDGAKKCVNEIIDKLLFPVRLFHDSEKAPSTFCVWGSQENNLWKAWEEWKINKTIYIKRTDYLPMQSNERFEILKISESFHRDALLSIPIENLGPLNEEPKISSYSKDDEEGDELEWLS